MYCFVSLFCSFFFCGGFPKNCKRACLLHRFVGKSRGYLVSFLFCLNLVSARRTKQLFAVGIVFRYLTDPSQTPRAYSIVSHDTFRLLCALPMTQSKEVCVCTVFCLFDFFFNFGKYYYVLVFRKR